MKKKSNLDGNTFADHPERINRAGRPRRSAAAKNINAYLEKLGCGVLSNSEFIEIYKRLFSCTSAQLKAIKADPSAPHELRMFVGGLLRPKYFLEFYKLHLNRCYGRPILPIIQERRTPIRPTDATESQLELLSDFDSWMESVDIEVQQGLMKGS
ncbi:MAG TPA: hypothetical protein VK658_13950 [Chryseolinea sp.]|nr:hypothetical protein [Chryseolinea sp.]